MCLYNFEMIELFKICRKKLKMSELPTSFGGAAMAMSEYYDADDGGGGNDYDEDEDNPMKVTMTYFFRIGDPLVCLYGICLYVRAV